KVNIAKTKRSKAGRSKVEVKGAKGSAVPKAKAQLVSQGEVSSRGRPIKRTFNYVADANNSEEELAPNDEDYIDSDQFVEQ
ncbi:UDP-N-acetylglucosamine 1-carboxyvinyltransferase 2, partial [Trichinella spiralis]|uniref:UDP-N-acetylglucosamine 1-carboxyvinyltransferase 2 n=2 Tax=Trichinella spiralis TaxID=6334 RepID=UPI0001EFEFED